jgi:hypothetical protein
MTPSRIPRRADLDSEFLEPTRGGDPKQLKTGGDLVNHPRDRLVVVLNLGDAQPRVGEQVDIFAGGSSVGDAGGPGSHGSELFREPF